MREMVNLKKFLALVLALLSLSTGALAASDSYVLLEREGLVGVFTESDTENPKYMTDIVVLSLPSEDRDMLSEGIKVGGEEALREILEDLGS